MKEVLALNGSPREKNTFTALTGLKEILEKDPGIRVLPVSLSKLSILPCTGCMACLIRGIEFCPLDDDLLQLLSRIREADGLILASPVFVLNVPGTMKDFIDRLAFLCHRPALFHQKGFVLVTVGGYGGQDVSDYLRKVLRTWGLSAVDGAVLTTPPEKSLTAVQKEKNRAALEKGAARFFGHLTKNTPPVPSWGQVMQFHMQRMIFTQPKAAETFPADHRFFSNLKGEPWYTEARVSLLKRGAGTLAESLLRKTVRF